MTWLIPLLAALVLAACQPESAPSAKPSPLVLSRPPTAVPRATPTPLPSGGLGLFRDEFETRYGANPRPRGRFLTYRSGQISIALANEIVWYIEREWIPEDIPRRDQARAQALEFIPRDAIHLGSYETRGATRYDRYRSAGLAERVRSAARIADPIDLWPNVDPGTFIIAYRERGEWVSGLLLMTGSTPP